MPNGTFEATENKNIKQLQLLTNPEVYNTYGIYYIEYIV